MRFGYRKGRFNSMEMKKLCFLYILLLLQNCLQFVADIISITSKRERLSVSIMILSCRFSKTVSMFYLSFAESDDIACKNSVMKQVMSCYASRIDTLTSLHSSQQVFQIDLTRTTYRFEYLVINVSSGHIIVIKNQLIGLLPKSIFNHHLMKLYEMPRPIYGDSSTCLLLYSVAPYPAVIPIPHGVCFTTLYGTC